MLIKISIQKIIFITHFFLKIFSWKRGLSQFLNIPIIYDGAKNKEKLPIPEKNAKLTDRQTDRQ